MLLTMLNNLLLINWFVISVRWPSRSLRPAISMMYVSSTPIIIWILGKKVSDFFLWPILKALFVTSSLYSMTLLVAGLLSTGSLLPPTRRLLGSFFSSSTRVMHNAYGPCSMADRSVDLPQPVSPMTRMPRLMLKQSILLKPMLRIRYRLVKFFSIFLTSSLSMLQTFSSEYSGASYRIKSEWSLVSLFNSSALFASLIGSFASNVIKNALSFASSSELPQSYWQSF